MSTPGQPLPPPKEPRRNSGTLLAAIVIAVVLMAIGCAGVCGGFLYFAVPRARVAMQQAKLSLPNVMVAPAPNDWMTTRRLSEVYTRTLTAVVADKSVIDRLGEPVLTDIDADELYRRTGDGVLGDSGEQIEFDIKGPKGTGVVAVGAIGAEINKITVTLEDDSTLDIPPPPPQPFIVR